MNSEKMLLLLGSIGIITGIIAVAANSKDTEEQEELNNNNEYQHYIQDYRNRQMMQQQPPEYYCVPGRSNTPNVNTYNQPRANQAPIQHQQEQFVQMNRNSKQGNTTPLGFSSLVSNNGPKENYMHNTFTDDASNYVDLNDYAEGSQNIPVYNPVDGSVGLPVPNMMDMGAAENNKYVYDRTIGTIGMTSTKIGGRRRQGADLIRGDLPIIPTNNGWFQVSPDPLNTLVDGAMNISNGISDSGSSAANTALNDVSSAPPPSLDQLSAVVSASANPNINSQITTSSGAASGQHAARATHSHVAKSMAFLKQAASTSAKNSSAAGYPITQAYSAGV